MKGSVPYTGRYYRQGTVLNLKNTSLFLKRFSAFPRLPHLKEEAFADTDQPDGKDDKGQNPLEIEAEETGEFQSFSGIDFCIKVILPPTEVPGAENGQNKSSERKQIIADNKIFKVKDIAGAAQRMEIT